MNKKFAILVLSLCIIAVSCSESTVRNPGQGQVGEAERIDSRPLQLNDTDLAKTATVDRTHPDAEYRAAEPYPASRAEAGAPMVLAVVSAESPIAASPYPGIPPYPPARPGEWNRESYNAIDENRFINSLNDPLSTFSIDVDTASYANIRRFLSQGQLPPRGAVRTEEMINYFSYRYPDPDPGRPFSVHAEAGPSPFHADYQLVRIGLKARSLPVQKLPPSNLTFLIDVSGSMNHPNKLGLLKQSLNMLTAQLGPQDRVAMVVYAGCDRVALMPTPGTDRDAILQAIDSLQSGGSTHASSGIVTAYELARKSFMPGGNNRVILASDGDFNVGISSRDELQALIEKQRDNGIYLTVLGFGDTNYHDDTMEILADKGNGNYAYIDSLLEANKVLVKERSSTLFALARDVKIQVEFNPAVVGAYRLIGYENRTLQDEDFQDDKKDAGEIGLGHTVTALYEVIPAGHPDIPGVDSLKYRQQAGNPAHLSEMLTVKVRYKPEGAQTSALLTRSLAGGAGSLDQTSSDFRFAASVAGFAMLLRQSEHLGSFDWNRCIELAKQARGEDSEGYRAEFIRLAEMAQLLRNQG
jgi:Ca-activated chloride channel family protein